ncbi:MAG: hypothetical protein WD649_00025 [Thermoleophilaceae bacterium]
MAFGQSSGPPATARQVAELLELVQAAGHADFRDARGPMGLTQRQAAGKFTRDEADAFIEQLQDEAHASRTGATVRNDVVEPERLSKAEQATRELPDEVLAAELQRRGWIVVEP